MKGKVDPLHLSELITFLRHSHSLFVCHGQPFTRHHRPFRRPRREPGPGRVTRSLRSLRSTSLHSSTRPTRGRSVHRHSGSSSLTFLVTSFLFTSLSSRPFGAHFIRPGSLVTRPSLGSFHSPRAVRLTSFTIPSLLSSGAGLRAPVPCRRGAFSLRSRTALPLPAFTSPFGRRDRRASGGV